MDPWICSFIDGRHGHDRPPPSLPPCDTGRLPTPRLCAILMMTYKYGCTSPVSSGLKEKGGGYLAAAASLGRVRSPVPSWRRMCVSIGPQLLELTGLQLLPFLHHLLNPSKKLPVRKGVRAMMMTVPTTGVSLGPLSSPADDEPVGSLTVTMPLCVCRPIELCQRGRAASAISVSYLLA